MRLLLARMWADLGERSEPIDHIIEQVEWLRSRWHRRAPGRITVGLVRPFPGAAPPMVSALVGQARAWVLATQIHLAGRGMRCA